MSKFISYWTIFNCKLINKEYRPNASNNALIACQYGKISTYIAFNILNGCVLNFNLNNMKTNFQINIIYVRYVFDERIFSYLYK